MTLKYKYIFTNPASIGIFEQYNNLKHKTEHITSDEGRFSSLCMLQNVMFVMRFCAPETQNV